MGDEARYEDYLRLVRLAMGLERFGQYNAAKLFWAAAFSEDVRAAEAQGVPDKPETLAPEMAKAIAALEARGTGDELLAVFRRAQEAVQQEITLDLADVPQVYVCRSCGEFMMGSRPYRCGACGARELTLREFPPVYYLEPLPPERAMEALAATPGTLRNMVEGLSEAQLAQAPEPGEWTLREALLHLLGAQQLLAARVDLILVEDNPKLESVAPEAVGVKEEMSTKEILERFAESREGLLARLEGLEAEAWWRTGQHTEFGEVTILQQASYFAKHDQSHLPQMDAIRAAAGGNR